MALLIAGTHSGCGKSTVTLGVLSALRRQGRTAQAFKAGPDFIDPGLHGIVTGRPSRNLDIWMCGEDYVKKCIAENSLGADALIIEGVMGFYDGNERSTAALARAVGTNTVLVVDAYGTAESAGAIIKGFNEYGARIHGVIFNRVGSESHYKRLEAAARGVEPLGYLPGDVTFRIPERHLGLLAAEENPISEESLDALTDAVLEHVDMRRIYELSRPDNLSSNEKKSLPDKGIRIGIAKDRAFCFYYEDNLDMLRCAGAELVPFSPLDDESLPTGIDALYIGGGYPEMYAKELSENVKMRQCIREWAEREAPIYAECGGFMYLGESIAAKEGRYPLVGVFPFKSVMKDKRAALGYREVRPAHDCILGGKGDILRGHEFHYGEIPERRTRGGVRYNVLGEETERVTSAAYKSTLAGYVHVHFGSRPGTPRQFINFIRERKWKE